jgi:hypothetical protein
LIARPGEADWTCRPVEDVECRVGETVSVLLAASWERYWAQAIRTFRVAGDRFEPLATNGTAVRFDAWTSGLRPGVGIGQWAHATHDAMSPAERAAIAPYGLGEAIGITPEEWPRLSIDNHVTIERGTCFAVRAAFESADGLILHGDTIVV